MEVPSGGLPYGGDPAEPELRWRRDFPGEAGQVHEVRRFVVALLPPCPARDDVVLCATELVTNCVRHTASGRGGVFAVELRRRPDIVTISVADQGAPTEPVLWRVQRVAMGAAECGREPGFAEARGPMEYREPAGSMESVACGAGPVAGTEADPGDLVECGRGLDIVSGLAVRAGVIGDERGRTVWADLPWPLPNPSPYPLLPLACEPPSGLEDPELARWHGIYHIWYGRTTHQWWAAPRLPGIPMGLIVAPTPQALAARLAAHWSRASYGRRELAEPRECPPWGIV